MKRGIIAAVLAAVLGFTGAADARHFGHGTGIAGKVTAVGKKTISVSVLSSGNNVIYTVKFSHGTRVTGPAAHGVDSSLIGHSVSIVGSGSGSTIKATEIVVAN